MFQLCCPFSNLFGYLGSLESPCEFKVFLLLSLFFWDSHDPYVGCLDGVPQVCVTYFNLFSFSSSDSIISIFLSSSPLRFLYQLLSFSAPKFPFGFSLYLLFPIFIRLKYICSCFKIFVRSY